VLGVGVVLAEVAPDEGFLVADTVAVGVAAEPEVGWLADQDTVTSQADGAGDGEVVEEDGLRFEVLESTDRKVERVRVTTVQPRPLKI